MAGAEEARGWKMAAPQARRGGGGESGREGGVAAGGQRRPREVEAEQSHGRHRLTSGGTGGVTEGDDDGGPVQQPK